MRLPLIAGLLLAAISLYFSATGLVHLFAGAGSAIVVMAVAFEVAKIASTVHLIRNFRWRLVPLALTAGLVSLVAISSLGVYGYLGRAYASGRKAAVAGGAEVAALRRDVTVAERDRARLDSLVASVPAEQGTNRRHLLAQVAPELRRIEATLAAKRDTLSRLERTQAVVEQDVGELRFAAELLGTTQDGIAKFVITTLAFLLDPLAVLLILASGVKGRRADTEYDRVTQAVTAAKALAAATGKPVVFASQTPTEPQEPRYSPALSHVVRRAAEGAPVESVHARRKPPPRKSHAGRPSG
jgi:hypothetical protein